jgi:hypothetical protein
MALKLMSLCVDGYPLNWMNFGPEGRKTQSMSCKEIRGSPSVVFFQDSARWSLFESLIFLSTPAFFFVCFCFIFPFLVVLCLCLLLLVSEVWWKRQLMDFGFIQQTGLIYIMETVVPS